MSIKLKVGSKGELFLPKAIRNQLDLHPGDTLILDIDKNNLVLRIPPSLEDLLDRSPLISLTLEEIEQMKREMESEQIGFVTEEYEDARN